ncbi:peroxisome proliferator-activated receptor gamma coactivator 1-alpha [Drosophila rhopaloa]|uniref:Peroxisome proliferator-activated receptor gamma coactivator 1-alpha n=1 Tax=Drosophila rhopaloa TaxID=1041015 RepID=A0A6P4F7K2_DRORH|nr:peroxisome proliferator-activated receptor gamma coactivator 1-alpha [Drosophila rhopaloa]
MRNFNSPAMDSRMLNVFQEDPFDGNYTKYESEPNFWSSNDDLQLTDTLNGILPIAPTDESLLSHSREEDLQNRKNLLIYSEFVEQELGDQDARVLNDQVYQAITDSEVEVAYEQQRQISAIVEYDREDIGIGGLTEEEEEGDDAQSQCSDSTFRTRTDSSSIGDYESHSSDYEDEYDVVDEEQVQSFPAVNDNIAPLQSSSDRKNRTLSTNTIISEVDAFGLNIDVNNFDLADFITKDDFAENLNACRLKETLPTQKQTKTSDEASMSSVLAPPVAIIGPKPKAPSSKARDSDYDSDSIIDVETVDVIDVDETVWAAGQLTKATPTTEDLRYVDNVKADPSWCPKSTKKTIPIVKDPLQKPEPVEAHQPTAPTLNKPKPANICLVPNKKQCDFLKRKVGASSVSKSTKMSNKKVHDAAKLISNKQLPANHNPCTGLGLGGKNLSLLKHERDAAVSACAADEPSAPTSFAITSTPPPTPAPKRKLNLEEYKQRRSGGVGIVKTKPTPPKQAKLEVAGKFPTPSPVLKPTPSPQKAAIVNIVNSLKCPSKEPATVPMDPITVAKNKVLRMLEMKRAQQLKIIDSRVSAKVPRVTKLPTLKDIVKDTYCMETEDSTPVIATPSNKLHPDYEEIIIVSVSCNTDITIPPNQLSKASPRSLLKSSVLLYNISNGQDANKNISNSLIASIQSEVVRQTSSTTLAAIPSNAPAKSSTDKNVQHGEDMVIMHLPKDRVRKTLVSISTQTDLQPEFPLLAMPPKRQSRELTRRSYRKRRNHGSGSNELSSSSGTSSDCSSSVSCRSRSRSDSIEQLRTLDAAVICEGNSIGNGGYSSRSTHRHRSSVSSSSYSEAGKYERRQRRTSYNKRRSKNQKRGSVSSSCSGSENSDRERSRSPHRNLRRSRSPSKSDTRYPNNNCPSNNNRRGFMDRNVSQPAVEERRIVYVGRIEQETTKELLRRKFLPYGSIKQITIHYKENGMKYGFVTYERAQDAFTAIDTSPRDSQINMYDISFGGRRAFCRASYADLDNAGINNYHSYVFPKEAPAPKVQEDSFEALLLKVKAKLSAGKPAASADAPAQEAQSASASAPQDHSQM